MPRLATASALLILAGWILPGSACAQVVINHAALDQLAGIVSAPPPAVAAPPVIRHVALRRRHSHSPAPLLAAAVRPQPVLAVVPLVRPAIPQAPKLALPAAAAITFAPGVADLPAGAPAALKPFCGAAQATVTVSAAAPVDPADPSAAMRLAMMRAFAVRGALIACGTSSANILPRTATSSLAKNPDATQITESR